MTSAGPCKAILLELDFTVHLGRNSQAHLMGLFWLPALTCATLQNCSVWSKSHAANGSLFLSMPTMPSNVKTGTAGTPAGGTMLRQPLQRLFKQCRIVEIYEHNYYPLMSLAWMPGKHPGRCAARLRHCAGCRHLHRHLTNSGSWHQILSSYDWITPLISSDLMKSWL